jgi:hypothetical protein
MHPRPRPAHQAAARTRARRDQRTAAPRPRAVGAGGDRRVEQGPDREIGVVAPGRLGLAVGDLELRVRPERGAQPVDDRVEDRRVARVEQDAVRDQHP